MGWNERSSRSRKFPLEQKNLWRNISPVCVCFCAKKLRYTTKMAGKVWSLLEFVRAVLQALERFAVLRFSILPHPSFSETNLTRRLMDSQWLETTESSRVSGWIKTIINPFERVVWYKKGSLIVSSSIFASLWPSRTEDFQPFPSARRCILTRKQLEQTKNADGRNQPHEEGASSK